MIDAFNRNPSDPEIDALIVDEAQDSSVPQLRALEKMARNVTMVGYLDQRCCCH